MRVTHHAVMRLMRVTTLALNASRDEETDPKRQTSNGYSGVNKGKCHCNVKDIDRKYKGSSFVSIKKIMLKYSFDTIHTL